MKLRDLEPQFLKVIEDGRVFQHVDAIADADGISFVCPGCLVRNNNVRPGVHSVICWQPHVPYPQISPGPGRWTFSGTGYDDLTLSASSSSIKVGEPECAHFHIRNGEIV